MKKIITILGLVTFSSAAFADVCGYLTLSQAEKTLSFLTKGAKLEQTYANIPKMTVKTVSVEKKSDVDYLIKVNGQDIDPGHVNVVINKKVTLNLGALVGCDVQFSDPNIISPTFIDGYLK